jgi:uncharacterized protein YjbI with pentapeptide repeats
MANLMSADLTKADFTAADLVRAKFNHAIMLNTILSGAILEDADLTGVTEFPTANLKFATLHGTIMPDGKLDYSGRIDR